MKVVHLVDGVDLSNAQVVHQFAWLPVYIRDEFRWVWFRRYTRVRAWPGKLGRFRTVSTFLGWSSNVELRSASLQ